MLWLLIIGRFSFSSLTSLHDWTLMGIGIVFDAYLFEHLVGILYNDFLRREEVKILLRKRLHQMLITLFILQIWSFILFTFFVFARLNNFLNNLILRVKLPIQVLSLNIISIVKIINKLRHVKIACSWHHFNSWHRWIELYQLSMELDDLSSWWCFLSWFLIVCRLLVSAVKL